MGLPVSTNWKDESYNLILVIVDCLIKMVYYKPVKVMIIILGLAEVIVNMVICQHGVWELIIMNKSLLFISKFWFSLYYVLSIKKELSTAFYSQTDSQTKR